MKVRIKMKRRLKIFLTHAVMLVMLIGSHSITTMSGLGMYQPQYIPNNEQ